MKKNNTLNFKQIFSSYFEILLFNPSRSESLRLIAEKASEDFGEFIIPGSFDLSGEIEISFLELLDQIVYEFREKTDYEPNIRDYIIEDLYSKISLHLEAMQDLDSYKKNIHNRSLIYDDIIIIRNRGLADLVPILLKESEEITNLQKPIAKAMLYFRSSEFPGFFSKIYRESTNGFIRCASVLGMKYDGTLENLADSQPEDKTAVYGNSFDLVNIYSNPLPAGREEMTFALLHIEKTVKSIDIMENVRWLMKALESVPAMNFENSWLHEINCSISNILLNIDINLIKKYIDTEECLIEAVNFIDHLPRNIFNRLTGRLDLLGLDFQFRLNAIIEKKKIEIDKYNSNIFNYLCWNSTEAV